jgi:hypothetical protein
VQGTPVSECPTAGRIGCCENINFSNGSIGYTYGYCAYSPSGIDAGQGPDAGPMVGTLESSCQQLGGSWLPD